MQTCDVAVIGGGPAGSTCARALRRAGLDVVVLDKERFPRDKVCAGWITPAVAQTLGLDVDGYAREHVLQPITGFRIASMGRKAAEIDYPTPVSYGIRRVEFDAHLLERSGARLRLAERLESLERDRGGWRINGDLRASMVVGAGGHFCPVARRLGGRPQGESVVAAQEVEFEMTEREQRACRIHEAVPELFFCEDLKGYAWCLRKGNYLNIGLGREDRHRIGEHVLAFIQMLRRTGRIGFNLDRRLSGHAYLLYGRARRKLVDDGVVLIGDAAGLAYAQSGEGIRPAIESGLMAARTLIAARGDHRAIMLAPYEQSVRRRFAQRRVSVPWVPQPLRRSLAHRLLATGWFARRVVVDRWFLHAHQAPLAVPAS